MAVVFMDGFDHYQLMADMTRKWTTWITNGAAGGSDLVIAAAYARGAGQGMAFLVNNRCLARAVTATATMTTGVAAYFLSNPAAGGTSCLFTFADSGTEQVSVRGDGSGHLTVYRGDGTLLATSTNSVTTGVWYYIEFKAVINNSTGTIEVRVNGTSTGWVPPTGSLDTQNTGNATLNQVALGMTANSGTYYDDFYACDASGSVNTTFLGPVRVTPLLPIAAGNYAQWTPSGGNNFGNVADMPVPDSDVTFNQSATAGQLDSFIYEDLPVSSGSVFAIQHVLYNRQDAGTQRTLAPLQRSSSTDYVGTNFNPSTSYTYQLEVKETNPDTSAAWTVSGVNNAEFGYKEVS